MVLRSYARVTVFLFRQVHILLQPFATFLLTAVRVCIPLLIATVGPTSHATHSITEPSDSLLRRVVTPKKRFQKLVANLYPN